MQCSTNCLALAIFRNAGVRKDGWPGTAEFAAVPTPKAPYRTTVLCEFWGEGENERGVRKVEENFWGRSLPGFA